ncbi:hypothetical protein GQ53DRAFT_793744 [Thozetella sp. PMI_491]|nr:hypothetical protein GQ53DRAFT_793744 [Thozetella sp. PMI_491]
MGSEAKQISDRSKDAEAKSDKQRRKIQNRKNQRSHRLRLKGEGAGAVQKPRPFKIRRWRLDEEPDVHFPEETSPASEGASPTHISPQPLHIYPGSSLPTAEHIIVPRESRLTAHLRQSSTFDPPLFSFPLSSDHLLHLIQYNVFRALITNKNAAKVPEDLATCPISGLYRHVTNLQPFRPNIPASLAPTALQQNHYRPIWINAIPFPRIRDNLIRHDDLFDHWDLLYDLIGEFTISTPATCVGGPPPTATASQTQRPFLTLPSGFDADEVTAGRNGLIVWGEPHETQNWEATPGFLAKWAWVVEGCEEELIKISNRWRMERGEEVIQISMSRSCPAPPPLTLAAICGV